MIAIIFRYLLFIALIGFGSYYTYKLLVFVFTWTANKNIKILSAKINKEKELDSQEAEIIIKDINKKTLKDRYKDRIPKNKAIFEQIHRKSNKEKP